MNERILHGVPRTAAQWAEIFDKLPSPNSVEHDIVSRVMADLWGYNHKSKYRAADVQSLAEAFIAYARLLQEHGVKV